MYTGLIAHVNWLSCCKSNEGFTWNTVIVDNQILWDSRTRVRGRGDLRRDGRIRNVTGWDSWATSEQFWLVRSYFALLQKKLNFIFTWANFTSSFTHEDPKSANRQSSRQWLFCFWDLPVQKLLVKFWWNRPLIHRPMFTVHIVNLTSLLWLTKHRR